MNSEGFKETEIGMIPKDWDLDKLDNLTLKIATGSTPPSDVREYVENGVNFIRSSNIFDFYIKKESIIKINEDSIRFLKNSEVKSGDVLLNITGDGITFLRDCIATDDLLPAYTNQSIAIIRVNNRINGRYLSYYLSLDRVKKYMEGFNAGSARRTLAAKHVREFIVPFPKREEQLKISEIIYSINRKIDLNNQMNQTLKQIGKTIFRHWFVHFEFPDENGQPYKSSGGEMVDSELGEIPKGWEVGKIYDICNVIYGAPFSSKLFNENGEGIPLVRIRDLKNYKTGFFTTERHPKGTLINPGDIIAGMDAEFRPYHWLGKISWMNQRICMFKPKHDYIHKFFIYQTVKVPLKFYENSKVGTTVIHLSKSDVDRFEVVIPPKNMLIKFYDFIDPIFQKMILNAQATNNLTIIRDFILPKLMSGQIRVNIPEEATVK